MSVTYVYDRIVCTNSYHGQYGTLGLSIHEGGTGVYGSSREGVSLVPGIAFFAPRV